MKKKNDLNKIMGQLDQGIIVFLSILKKKIVGMLSYKYNWNKR